MPEVTLLKPQKNGKRVNVYLDGVFGFGIDLDNLVLSHIKIGSVLTDEEVQKIVRKAEFQKTLDKLLRFATFRPRSEKEIDEYLKRKKVHESMWKDLIEKLIHFELLDDAKFAKWWVDQRLAFKKISTRVLKLELGKKGIDKNTIDDVLEETPIDEEKMARELLAKRAYKWDKLDPKIAKQKKFQYLAGKGFDWEVVKKILADENL
jgi:regulatory protein